MSLFEVWYLISLKNLLVYVLFDDFVEWNMWPFWVLWHSDSEANFSLTILLWSFLIFIVGTYYDESEIDYDIYV